MGAHYKTVFEKFAVNFIDYEVRDCIRKYSLDFSLKRQKSVFNAINKPILVKTSTYLNILTENLKKPEIIHLLICKIQNLLPDTCQICKEKYVSDIKDPSFLACELCDQEVHKACFMAKLGLTSDKGVDLHKLLNPYNLPGIHYFCSECENDVVPPNNSNTPSLLSVNSTLEDVSDDTPQTSANPTKSSSYEQDKPPTQMGTECSLNSKVVVQSDSSCNEQEGTDSPKLVPSNNELAKSKSKPDCENKTKTCVFLNGTNVSMGLRERSAPFFIQRDTQNFCSMVRNHQMGAILERNVNFSILRCARLPFAKEYALIPNVS